MTELDWRSFNPLHHIEIQNAVDQHLQNKIASGLAETQRKEDRLFKVNYYLSMIEEALRIAREKGKDHVDLSKVERGKEILDGIWEDLKEDYPDLMGSLPSPLPSNMSKVEIDRAVRIIDQFRNAQQKDQRAIDAIARSLKLAADLNELVGRMNVEKAKHREEATMVHNQRTAH